MKPRFFKSSGEFRSWLSRNRASASELWIGFHKKASGKAGISYGEALDEALCFGWIMSVKKEETRSRRLDALIAESEHGRRMGLLNPPKLRDER